MKFWKMHGAGNDFVMVDDRQLTFPLTATDWLRKAADRRTGIGCDGFMLIQPSAVADFRIRFINPDGGEVGMCGNGARCVARLAQTLGIADTDMVIESAAGNLRAEVLGDQVRLHMTPPTAWQLNQQLVAGDRQFDYHFVDTGVEHAVVFVDDLAHFPVTKYGALIRHHDLFANGTNANFVSVTDSHQLRIRTYERGVEDETLACGTGITAAAIVAGRLGLARSPIAVTCQHGDVLRVAFGVAADGVTDVTLTGPAVFVFTGDIAVPS